MLVPVVVSTVMIGIRFFLSPYLGDTGPFFLASLAVLVSAYIGGFWPGLLATFITTTAGLTFFMRSPIDVIFANPKQGLILSGQIVICTSIALICEALKSSEDTAAASVLREREARGKLDALFNSITDKLITLSTELRLISFNKAAAERWGVNNSQLGLPLIEVLPRATGEALAGPLRTTLELNEPASLEIFDESLGRTYEVRVFPSPEGLLVYFRNISDRIEASKEISSLAEEQQKTNALFETLLNHAPVGFAFFDRAHRCERINSVLADMNGAAISDLVNEKVGAIIPFDSAVVESAIEKVFATGRSVDQLETSGLMPGQQGTERHWHTGLYPVKGSHEAVKSVGAVVIEITQRRQMEDRLTSSEARFRSVADNSPVFIWVCDAEGNASWFNQPWLDFRSMSLDEAICEGCFGQVHPDDHKWVEEAYREALRQGRSFSLEFRNLASKGEYRWIHLKANPMTDESGRVTSYLMSGIDVTDRIAMEENLRKSLANARVARSDAEKANRLKDEFLASLSHELRTPLTTMLGWTELLMKPNVPSEELKSGLEVIQRSSRLQLQLINDLLDMSRISVGKFSLELEYAELFDTVQSAVDLVQSSAESKGVTITLREPADPIIVKIDTDRFTQVVWNLLSNAIKFTPGGGLITIRVGHESNKAFVEVSDTGVGIEESFLPHVFERFRQADAGRSRRHGGLGLGLAIARQITELHGGTILVASEGVNRGSKFIVKIPLADQASLKIRNVPIDDIHSQIASRRLDGMNILLVEDDAPSRDVLRRILEAEGALVLTADSAVVARRLFRSGALDLVISDIGLPDEDGNQLMRTLRGSSSGDGTEVPSIALTAFAGEDERLLAFEAGFNSYLVKPVESEDLIKAIEELTRTTAGR